MTTMIVVGECFFWYRLTRVVPDNFHRAVKRLCVCVLLADTSSTCSDMNYKNKEYFFKLSMQFDAFNGYFVVDIKK